mmetsp:Transcript_12250/g.22231  ORF Transcript_12250/g.22231 Transcript_12250/m.22231 type:complete len:208 (-) Transcript_12250:200-823(-)|eukprot:CAMPEP_0198295362 /NCGR_PEP_ID=MMETSP1449-20131203/27349_1 /TAXON_ID=420275 /ORGANISM="Attheya septentrionalis, Strain CCMP2084" /LENGTH=207 /DNA_ID=CAMNT_0043995647 /DNA_START=126 /DNA_END=749 /DNA_ORIENTATION=-
MKLNTPFTLVALVAASASCSAFVMPSSFGVRTTTLQMAVELIAEPAGGEEVTAFDTMPATRVKDMGPVLGETSYGEPVHEFWLSSEADGTYIKEIRTQVSKDAAKKANFPGFRKGQIPPYAQPRMTMFAVQEAIVKTCEGAVSAYGLKSKGQVEVKEDVKEIADGYKMGDSVEFTAVFQAAYDPKKKKVANAPSTTTSEDEPVTPAE